MKRTPAALSLSAALLLIACGGHDDDKYYPVAATAAPTTSNTTPSPTPTGPGLPPIAAFGTPVNATGQVGISYTLIDLDTHPADILFEYSMDAGMRWQPATDAGAAAGSDGTTGLTTSDTGSRHTFVWDAEADLGKNLRNFVVLRLTPSDVNGAGATVQCSVFAVDATAPAEALTVGIVPVSTAGPTHLSAFDVSAGGALTVGGSATATGGDGRQMSSTTSVLATPRGEFVYATQNASAQIAAFSVDPTTRALTPLAGSPFATSANPTVMAMDPAGRFLYTTTGGECEAFAIDATTGDLTPVAGSPFAVGSDPRGLVVHPLGHLLFTVHMFGAERGVRVHAIDPTTGALTLRNQHDLSGQASRPKQIAINPQGTRVFVADIDNGIFVLDVDPGTGALTQTGAPHDLGAFLSGTMTATTRGDHLYVSVSSVGLLGFSVAANGDLTPVPGSPLSNVGASSLHMQVDGADGLLFAASRTDDDLRAYSIDPATGALTEVPGSPFANPNANLGVVGPLLVR